MVVFVKLFIKNFHFDTILYLQHYQGTTRNTEKQLCWWVHRQVCCDKISSIAVKGYKYLWEMAFQPVRNGFILYTSLKKKNQTERNMPIHIL